MLRRDGGTGKVSREHALPGRVPIRRVYLGVGRCCSRPRATRAGVGMCKVGSCSSEQVVADWLLLLGCMLVGLEPRVAARRSKAQIRLHATVARCWSLPDSLVRLTRVRPQFHRNATARHALGAHCHQSCLLVTAALPSHLRTHSTRQHGGKLQPTSDSAQSYTHAFWLMIRLHDRSTGSCSSAARARCAWPSGSPPCRPRRSSRSPRT